MIHDSSWESQWVWEAAISCTGEAPAGSEETEESRGAADAPCQMSVRHTWCGGQLQGGGYRQGGLTEGKAVGPGSIKREEDFPKREKELQNPGRQSYRSGWMVIK